MRRSLPFLHTLASLAVASAIVGLGAPLQAQDRNVNMAYFVTTSLAHVVQFEEGMRAHVGWHAQQGDPWPGFVYQAMQGGPEYVWVSPNHTWADFDDPPVDPHADMVDFAERAGAHSTGLDARTWVTWTGLSIPPAPDAVVPIWQVIEWKFLNSAEGGQAVRAAFAKVKGALEGQGGAFRYTVNEVVAADTGPELFVAIAHQSLGEMDGGAPDALPQLLAQAYGHADAVQVMRTLETHLTPIANRFWVLRPDLSHMPGM